MVDDTILSYDHSWIKNVLTAHRLGDKKKERKKPARPRQDINLSNSFNDRTPSLSMSNIMKIVFNSSKNDSSMPRCKAVYSAYKK